ncbi:uncharacterized protein BDR25DRAFT_346363 [Lindgomyces ingoldianus]|uniref:Uncharacterized protein n=1 Tax=Lindgomyces ingoldianus TaxID=673940 RepID=A0ACB6QFZ5_9PLEO|nr:uncharacterized protein BDR25DRAFT_346363 [Lindgomyces ingoldianus]KAF2465065.1 hypothetical protein BDR25DRAFT_346363 [Lindgomyces ingoldianus]
MRVLLEDRQSCSSGEQWYVCASNGFSGCCAVDPCALSDGCPSSSGSHPTTSSGTASNILSSFPASAFTTSAPKSTAEASSIRIEASSSGSNIQTIASVSGGQTVYVTVTHDPSSTSQLSHSPTSNPNLSQKDTSRTPVGAIAGGVISGTVVLGIALLLFFFLRRKRQAKERKRATLPPSYAEGDMSEFVVHDGSIAPSNEISDAVIRGITNSKEKAGLENVDRECVPQLDGRMIRPTNEMGADPIGSIAELPASQQNPFATPNLSANESGHFKSPRRSGVDVEDHVMSWAQFNSMGKRDPSSRLSQPHGAPDTSASVWGTLSPTQPEENKERQQ